MSPLLRLPILLAGLAAASLVAAQEEDELTEELDEAQTGVLVEQHGVPLFTFRSGDLETLIVGEPTSQAARQKLKRELLLRIEVVHRLCGLEDGERAKLRLAGELDIKRLFDRVEAFRHEWTGSIRNGKLPAEFLIELHAMRVAVTNPQFGEESFFDKIARRMLTGEQLTAYLMQVDRRGRVQREDLIRVLGEKVALQADLRNKFAALLTRYVPTVEQGPQEFWRYAVAASQIPEEKYRGVLDEGQWNQLKLLFDQAKERIRALERSSGLEPEHNAEDNSDSR
jgi:hypothetical protein